MASALAATTQSAPAQPNASANNEGLESKLKAFLAASKKNLGELQPWQSKLFDDEALPQYSRFIRDYRATRDGGVEAQIDYDSLRQYLGFYGPTTLKQPKPSLIVVLAPQIGCDKCVQSTEVVRDIVRVRLKNRGMNPEWTTPSELGSGDPVTLASRYAEVKKAAGALVIRWGIIPSDEVDAAHADETQYLVRSNIEIRDFAKHEGSLELLEAGSFDRSVAKLLTDDFTYLGEQAVHGVVASGQDTQHEEALIDIRFDSTGAWGYSQYAKLRDSLAAGLQSLGSLEERSVAHEHAVFVLYSSASPATIGEKIATIAQDGVKLSAPTVDGHTLHLDAQAGARR